MKGLDENLRLNCHSTTNLWEKRPLTHLMERTENLHQAYLRLTERVHVSLQIHVGDAARFRALRNNVLDFLTAAGQVGTKRTLSDIVADIW